MSLNHQEHGHFSQETQTAIKKLYKHVCALCNRPGRACDHIFPLNAIEYADAFEVDIHSIENGWLLCDKCHSVKSKAENDAYPNGDLISRVYNRYWQKAFTRNGNRRVKKITSNSEVNMVGVRAWRNYVVQGNRLKVALKNALKDGNPTKIKQLEGALQAWRDRNPKGKRRAA